MKHGFLEGNLNRNIKRAISVLDCFKHNVFIRLKVNSDHMERMSKETQRHYQGTNQNGSGGYVSFVLPMAAISIKI